MAILKNSIHRLDITHLNDDAQGIGLLEGKPIIVEGVLPGERVEIKAIKIAKAYVVGKLQTILRPSPDRMTPFCPVFDRCGGCSVQHLAYPAQLALKTRRVREFTARLPATTPIVVHDTLGMAQPRHFRHKAQYPVMPGHNGVALGFYAKHSHRLIEHRVCGVQADTLNHARDIVKEFLETWRVSIYDETRHEGLVRHLVMRSALHTGEMMMTLVINGDELPHQRELIQTVTRAMPNVTGILLNSNRERTNIILGSRMELIYGVPQIRDQIGELTFAISPLAFYQVNPAQTEILYAKALEYAALTGEETVFDLYSGIGSLSLFLSRHARQVYGVEIVEDAVRDAIDNARLNSCKNVEFFSGAAETVIPDVVEQGLRADVVVLDPPRKGCEPAVLDTIIRMSPQRIVYVSCHLASLFRDLRVLVEHGYAVAEIQPVDMFPHTPHVECVASLVRR
ncbi:23S rRNA m(5)U-1939 methyltransferase [Candidatus Moduliflexus flocculans]|uniref:23S rRNA m(5)U-1939 methyltransferase n=1 Tax=Candidatus Moduliflexus flocculans TaxID=1499966 RepID=A0A0S6VRM2_9BACT|nr:23S rRNA m(5)U-1939 methyltransferase [Candidatus Moduliflexus flocculans]